MEMKGLIKNCGLKKEMVPFYKYIVLFLFMLITIASGAQTADEV
jgi:hypothetical protein